MANLAIIAHQAFSLINFRGPLIRDLICRGVRVYALAPDYDETLRESVRALGAEPIDFSLVRAGLNPLRDGVDTLRLALLLNRLRVDMSLAYTIKPVIYGTLAAWLTRVPRRFALIEGLGFVFTPGSKSLSIQRRLLRHAVVLLYAMALRLADRVIFLNQDDLTEFIDLGTMNVDKAIVLGGIGVDLSEWLPAPPVTKPITFLLAARLLREKGIMEYAAAARRVKASYPEARFVLLGALDPNPGGVTHAEVDAWVREGLLEWPGHVDVNPWLAQASVYVLPSYREGVPRSTQEAMAMARPVITTDAPGCRETVEDGVNGFLVPVRDVGALAAAMLRFIENPTLIETMGHRSREIAEKKFDVHKVNGKLLREMGFV